jgi:hypothetical protein
MAFWVAHYSELFGEDFSSVLPYIDERSQFAMLQFPEEISFEITSGGGQKLMVWEATVSVTGRGWIDVDEIHVAGGAQPLDVEWLDGQTWRASVPVALGSQQVRLEAFDRQGSLVGNASIEVVRQAGEPLLGDLDLSGVVDPDDIAALAVALVDRARYEATYFASAADLGDFDFDGDVDYDDIGGFVERLVNHSSASALATAEQDQADRVSARRTGSPADEQAGLKSDAPADSQLNHPRRAVRRGKQSLSESQVS